MTTPNEPIDIPAFPGMEYDLTAGQRYHYGMTLRDYFAGQALVGLITIASDLCEANKTRSISPRDMAINSYIYADAMLKARQETRNAK